MVLLDSSSGLWSVDCAGAGLECGAAGRRGRTRACVHGRASRAGGVAAPRRVPAAGAERRDRRRPAAGARARRADAAAAQRAVQL